MLKKTPLHSVYSQYEGVKLIDFGDWDLPVNFDAGIIAEHMAVRQNAGLFDVSHMGEFMVEGPGSEEFLEYLVTNRVKGKADFQCVYTPMCYTHGGTVDDLLIYKYNAEKFMIVVNASNIDKDFAWFTKENPWAKEKTLPKITNVSDITAQIAFQGPKAQEYLQEFVSINLDTIKFFHFQEDVELAGKSVLISRTGYTGEDGFEIYMAAADAPEVWNFLYEKTKGHGVLPCGLGCRDTLRFEAKLPLYGHEITDDISPLEGGLKFFVKTDKVDFCGKEALDNALKNGIARELRGCELIDKGVPRQGYKILKNNEEIGSVTSGAKSPMLDKFVGLVLVKKGSVKLDDEIEIEIGKKLKKAKIVKTPFYKNT